MKLNLNKKKNKKNRHDIHRENNVSIFCFECFNVYFRIVQRHMTNFRNGLFYVGIDINRQYVSVCDMNILCSSITISFISRVDFKKWSCRPITLKGQRPHACIYVIQHLPTKNKLKIDPSDLWNLDVYEMKDSTFEENKSFILIKTNLSIKANPVT